MSAFADTSALYALLVRTDQKHAVVAEEFRRFLQSGRNLCATSYVLVETTALLQTRIGLEVARDFQDHIVPILSIEWVSEDLHQKGINRWLREDRRQLSLVDCVSLEFIRAAGLRDVLGLDRHFAEAGLRLLP